MQQRRCARVDPALEHGVGYLRDSVHIDGDREPSENGAGVRRIRGPNPRPQSRLGERHQENRGRQEREQRDTRRALHELRRSRRCGRWRAADSAEKSTGGSAAVNSHCLVATSAAEPYQPDAAIGNNVATAKRSDCTMIGLTMLDTVIHPPTLASSRSATRVAACGRAMPGATPFRTKKCATQYATLAATTIPTATWALAPNGRATSGPA